MSKAWRIGISAALGLAVAVLFGVALLTGEGYGWLYLTVGALSTMRCTRLFW